MTRASWVLGVLGSNGQRRKKLRHCRAPIAKMSSAVIRARRGRDIRSLSNASLFVILFISTCLFLTIISVFQGIPAILGQQNEELLAGQQQQSLQQTATVSILPPVQQRPSVRVNIRDWTRRISDDIRLVSNRTSCVNQIGRYYEESGEYYQLDPVKLRESTLGQINSLLAQHKAAVNGIVMEAEKAAMAHNFIKNLRLNYTDVHRIRNELEPWPANLSQEQMNDYTTNQYGGAGASGGGLTGGSSSGDRPQFTSISGGTPVPGPPEWQTPIKSVVMQVNRNFGDIPVNISMSAVHLPLPIYPGLPEIMNGIAWSERLDAVFRHNLIQYMHVHHQYYGDRLGFLRTFPAHKWRIPRNEPDLFDARTRPWYIAGAATPKDVVVLVDTSGSMTGLRREIARGVVFEILDTLTINDHFAVLRFSETVTPVGLPKCNLKMPRLVPQLEEQCPASGPGQKGSILLDHMSGSGNHHQPVSLASSGMAGAAEQRRDLITECANWRRQWESRGQYLRDHPSVQLGRNGSYLTDDAYRQSIVNVSLDIRDAFLLPATGRNVRYLKSNFSMPTAGIANFTRALMAGFELLQAYGRSGDKGSQCNQAIMLITDGAIKSQEEVFNRYNYPNAPVRVFTYMIGREVGDIRPTKEMACRNRGYYAHVINLSEVREQVQKYLPVMARPLVLAHNHPITWTNAYGDETHQVLTDWVLEVKRRERARLMLSEERERLSEANSSEVINTELTGLPEYDELPLVDEVLKNRIICEDAKDEPEEMDKSLEEEIDPLGYNELACHWTNRRADLLTSVVKPVFDLRNTSIFFERFLSKNVWQEKEIQLRNAQLLGVAAVDLRVDEIMRAAPSHLLGPNAYAILLGQNGFVMHHPDFRALLEDPFDKYSKILKPYFNAVDLTHIEQVYHKNETDLNKRRDEDTKLVKLREAAVKRATGSESMYVKRTTDCRRRPHIRLQTFYYGPIKDTPYSFMLALPQSYGLNRVEAKLALDKNSYTYLRPNDFDLWTVHPDYRYCEPNSGTPIAHLIGQLHLNDSLSTLIRLLNMTAEGEPTEIEYEDLSAISGQTADGSKGSRAQQQQQRYQSSSISGGSSLARFVCDKELFPSLLFDARATYDSFVSTVQSRSRADTDEDGACTQTSDEMRTKLAQIYGLEMSFVATRSGLTRTRVFEDSPRIKKLAKLFIERHGRAVDEAWYSRTVDWNMRFSEDATIISVAYNAYIRLIAKLRQRITQRHPAVNDTRANCDPSLMEEETAEAGSGQMDPALATTGDQQTTIPSEQSVQPLDRMQNDEPVAVVGQDGVSGSVRQQQPKQQEEGTILMQDQQANDTSEGELPAGSGQPPRINYNEYSSFDFLDLLANSSVHVSAFQSVIVNRAKRQSRSPVGVTGHLYDYASFARRFLNSTSLDIRTYPQMASQYEAQNALPVIKVDICPNGDCPTKCGYRNDTIDCLLVDNNGFIVVGEELPYIGRSLVDYDDRLMQSLIDRKVFHQVQIIDYQAICARNDQPTTNQDLQQPSSTRTGSSSANLSAMLLALPSSSAADSTGLLRDPFRFELVRSVVANFAAGLVWVASTIYSAFLLRSATNGGDPADLFGEESLLGRLHQWQRSALMAEAQSAIANQSLLALLPNKTYLRPCERSTTVYESRPYEPGKLFIDSPEYYVTKCNCSGWYVYDAVPKTNLIMLIVNTTIACRRCADQPLSATNTGPLAPIIAPGLIDTPNTAAAASTTKPQPLPPLPASSGLDTVSVSSRTPAEEQVCAMLERDQSLYVHKPTSCLTNHPDESQIHICGSATGIEPSLVVLLLTMAIVQVTIYSLSHSP
uniref:Voltage-dependent calcium channel unc-36 n=2 Tax=Aceria tosichella TaxID=561515 RepID=A0A6G1SFK5_9ACAR